MILELSLDELREIIATRGTQKSLAGMRKHTLPTRLLRDLYDQEPTLEEILFISGYPLSPSLLLEQIAADTEEAAVVEMLTRNPRTPHAVLNHFAGHADPVMRAAAAGNKVLPAREMTRLADDACPRVREALARNPGLRPQHFALLALDSAPVVRLALTQNPAITEEVILLLSDDPSPIVRFQLITATPLSDELLNLFASSGRRQIEEALLQRPRLPLPCLQQLTLSDYPEIRRQARALADSKGQSSKSSKSPSSNTPDGSLLLWMLESEDPEERTLLAALPALPPAIQKRLATDTSSIVRETLASRRDLDESVALAIAVSNDVAACCRLAENTHISPKILEELSRHDSTEVRKRLAYRKDLSSAQLDFLLNDAGGLDFHRHFAILGESYPALRWELAAEFAEDPAPSLRCLAAASRRLPPAALARLTEDPAPSVRLAAAANPLVPKRELFRLGDDEDEEVARTAKITIRQILDTENALRNTPPATPLRPASPPPETNETPRLLHKFKRLIIE